MDPPGTPMGLKGEEKNFYIDCTITHTHSSMASFPIIDSISSILQDLSNWFQTPESFCCQKKRELFL